ncbi:unnamed protein product [Blepharisma stoltei]|uniref:Thioredoxin domain-containing protein n=1 Tax=Blepharisma stoltei TaxID=1481888 RepID=A0AAU9JXK1_9CILI|nr:unnamed protein product [Blepharisma stoltei]
MKALLGSHLLSKTGLIGSQILDSQPLILLYFSASWCPPCRQFTPTLIDFYNKVNTPKKQAEVVLIPADRTEEDFIDYYEKMPWLSVPFANASVKQLLGEKYKVQTIPTLVLTDKDGNALNTNCRWEVVQKGVEALKGWEELVAKTKTK